MGRRRSKAETDEFIRRLHSLGSVPGNIAGRVGMSVDALVIRMKRLGIKVEASTNMPKYHVHPMWEMEPDKLRYAIWERQRRGAIEALMGRAA